MPINISKRPKNFKKKSKGIKGKVLFSRASTRGEAGDKFKTLSKPK
jgi:hypothetical protein